MAALTNLPTLCSMCSPGVAVKTCWLCSYCKQLVCPHIFPADHQGSRICVEAQDRLDPPEAN